uniref:Gustatory receptor n=1 Tax=Anopheles maculatus TaxID=74869 RepID=A0A182T1A5_9DIPT
MAKISVVKVINFIVLNLLLIVVAVIHHSIPYDLVNNGSIIVTYGIRTLLVGVYILSRRFEHLNDVLELRFDTSNGERDGSWLNETKYRNGSILERVRGVQKLSDLYHQLNAITDHMNGVFGEVFLANMLVVMLFCTFNIFALFKVYASNDLSTRMFTAFNLCGTSYYTMMFMLISNMARTVAKQTVVVLVSYLVILLQFDASIRTK